MIQAKAPTIMSWTKRQFITQALEEIGYASYAFDLEPEQFESAMRRLDALAATWNGKGIRIGYPIPSSPELSDLDQETQVPDAANEAIYLNLAIRIAPTLGKVVSIETKVCAKMAYNQLLLHIDKPQEQQLPSTMPLGAGAKHYSRDCDRPFVMPPKDLIYAGDDGEVELN